MTTIGKKEIVQIDIVMIAYSNTEELIKITNNALKSLYESEDNIKFHVYLVESQHDVKYEYKDLDIKMIYPIESFGYHKYLNIGRKAGNSEYVVLCNNDLIFEKNWASNILRGFNTDLGLMSAGPYNSGTHFQLYRIPRHTGMHYGYRTGLHIPGWCIFQKRAIYDIIGDLDERFVFWCCDDDYGMTLKTKGIKHALITDSIVNHVESRTLNTKPSAEKEYLTNQQYKVFKQKWNLK